MNQEWGCGDYMLVAIPCVGSVIGFLIGRAMALRDRERRFSEAVSNGEIGMMIGGHVDPVTGERHGIWNYANRQELVWYPTCIQCVTDRNKWEADDLQTTDPYASVRDVYVALEYIEDATIRQPLILREMGMHKDADELEALYKAPKE